MEVQEHVSFWDRLAFFNEWDHAAFCNEDAPVLPLTVVRGVKS